MTQIARGEESFDTMSSSEEAPVAPSLARPATVSWLKSKTTHSCPFFIKAAHHIAAHPTESDHSKLHGVEFFWLGLVD